MSLNIKDPDAHKLARHLGKRRSFVIARALIASMLLAQLSVAASPPKQLRLDHGRFHQFPVYAPANAPTSFVLLLSDDRGWNRSASDAARRLARTGAMVAGVDLAKLTAELERDAGQCVSPAGDLENLSHFVQAYEHLPTYLRPLLVGLQAGDLVLFQNTLAAGTGQAIAEVTNAAGGGGTYTVNFLNGDPLQFNQSVATGGDLQQIITGANTTATRIFVISYYLKVLPDPLGVGPGVPVLMRQVSGHLPVPVAENVANLQFTYDTYDAAGNLLNAVGNAGYPGTSLNLIRKVNVVHLTIRGQLSGARSYLMTTNGYQSYDFQTSISARNLSYQNRYKF